MNVDLVSAHVIFLQLFYIFVNLVWKVKVLVCQSCPTLCDRIDCSPPGSSVRGILQARVLEWAAIPISRPSWCQHDQGLIRQGKWKYTPSRFKIKTPFTPDPFLFSFQNITMASSITVRVHRVRTICGKEKCSPKCTAAHWALNVGSRKQEVQYCINDANRIFI